jgi:hypothetical protein
VGMRQRRARECNCGRRCEERLAGQRGSAAADNCGAPWARRCATRPESCYRRRVAADLGKRCSAGEEVVPRGGIEPPTLGCSLLNAMLGIRFHDLRHTHATLLLAKGVNPKVVQERLGHATVSITLDVYSHVTPSLQQDAAERLQDLFIADS